MDPAPARHGYGSDPAQYGQLFSPRTSRHAGVVVIIHGGFWRAQYDASLGVPLAQDLITRGYTVWNLEYRRVGNGGGWPNTFLDVASGIDHLASLGVDTSRVVAIGHSAGGQLAAWAAARARLDAGAPGAAPRVAVTAVIAQAGVLDLVSANDQGVGASAVSDLLGGSPAALPDRYAMTDPIQQVPLPVPVLCVHAPQDPVVPIAQSSAYVAAANAVGAQASLVRAAGDHFTLIDPTSPDWQLVVDALPDLIQK